FPKIGAESLDPKGLILQKSESNFQKCLLSCSNIISSIQLFCPSFLALTIPSFSFYNSLIRVLEFRNISRLVLW
ncbi:MAG: hypothetical protein ACI9YL_001160, partial [Luteibaculaceae bacterium]